MSNREDFVIAGIVRRDASATNFVASELRPTIGPWFFFLGGGGLPGKAWRNSKTLQCHKGKKKRERPQIFPFPFFPPSLSSD